MNATRERLLASSILGGAMLMALASASSAYAAEAATTAGAEVEEIVVTGSLFRRTDTETPSPVTVLTTENLEKAGITTATEAIRSVSADGAGSIGTGFQSGFSAGGSAVSLRGLGVSSTLVLIDGLRSTNFPINDDGHNAYVDLNSIPFSLIENIEVLKDGASSIYGADAIGGVVNLKLKRTFQGIEGTLEGGQSAKNDAEHRRADITVGYGDYSADGWNLYVNAEWQTDGRVTSHSRGFPFNTRDLSSIGGLDNNTADSTLTTATPNAVVTRVRQTDLSNPLAGGVGAPLTTSYQLLNPACPFGTYTVTTGAAQGTGCKHNIEDEYFQLAPLQERYAFNGKLSFKINDKIDAYISGSYSNDFVSIKNAPRAIRATQPYGGAPALASSNPGIVLPVYVCSSGVNCATAGDRRLNPNNPFATAFAADPSNGAARIYYTFGDLQAGSDRANEVIRGAAGASGTIGDGWDWKVDAVAARDNLQITQYGYPNIANLLNAINTGSYNFVNPSANTAAVRSFVSPNVITPSNSQMLSLEGSVTHKLMDLTGGPMMLAVGAQIRREELTNRNQNARLDTYTLTTSSAFGQHTVGAAYFEVEAPLLENLVVSGSGRYDNYSEGFSHFSPKLGAKWTPIKELALRATYSQGFRAPTFGESGPLSSFAGFVTTTPPTQFQLQHGGLVSSGNTNPYAAGYSLGRGFTGNPNLEPETSRSFTFGAIAQPFHWLSMTVDYYNVRKEDLIVAGPDAGRAGTAYYGQTTSAAGCAAVAAIGPGYSCNVIDAVDPLFPAAMPRLLILNAPYVNANASETSGIDFSATAVIDLPGEIKWTSKLEATKVIAYDLFTPTGTQHYAGTLGPYDLSSGNGTPEYRGNWQNTLEKGRWSLAATAYWVGEIKSVSADQGVLTNTCADNLYSSVTAIAEKFCHIESFLNVDMNGAVEINDSIKLYANIGNVFDERAPIAPAAYASAPNFLTTWHYAGLIGRTYKVGVKFKF